MVAGAHFQWVGCTGATTRRADYLTGTFNGLVFPCELKEQHCHRSGVNHCKNKNVPDL
jgi:hypothetical protein